MLNDYSKRTALCKWIVLFTLLFLIGNSFRIRLGQLVGLTFLNYHSPAVVPLVMNGNTNTISQLFIRYLSTIKHINSWFESDPFDPNSSAFLSLKIVRHIHKKVAHKMNTNQNQANTLQWISQYDLTYGQMSFVCMMALFPKQVRILIFNLILILVWFSCNQLGFHHFTKKDFHSIFHFWRVIGYCIGIDDEYNLCSGTDEETIELCRQIYFKEWLPVINKPDKVGVELSKGINIAMQRVSPLLDYNPFMRFCAKFLLINPEQYPLKNVWEKLFYLFYYVFFNYLTKSITFIWFINQFNKFTIKRAFANKQMHQLYLKKKYSHIKFEYDQCPFNVPSS